MLSLQCAITRDLIDNSDPGYTRLKQQLEKNNFCLSIQKHWQEEEERERQMQRVLRYTQTQTEIRFQSILCYTQKQKLEWQAFFAFFVTRKRKKAQSKLGADYEFNLSNFYRKASKTKMKTMPRDLFSYASLKKKLKHWILKSLLPS